jgi:hypothetical protein
MRYPFWGMKDSLICFSITYIPQQALSNACVSALKELEDMYMNEFHSKI